MRLLPLFIFALVACCCAVTSAAAVDIAATPSLHTIEGSIRLARGANKYVDARVLLNGGERVALVRADGSFRFDDVQVGRSYLVEAVMKGQVFAPVRVTVSGSKGSGGAVKVKAHLPTPTSPRVTYPLQLRSTRAAVYYSVREPVNWLGLLKNPMAIMMIVTLVMVVVMPRMMNNMDPAELEEMKKMQSNFSLDSLRRSLEEKANAMQQPQQQQQRSLRR